MPKPTKQPSPKISEARLRKELASALNTTTDYESLKSAIWDILKQREGDVRGEEETPQNTSVFDELMDGTAGKSDRTLNDASLNEVLQDFKDSQVISQRQNEQPVSVSIDELRESAQNRLNHE